MKGTLLKMYDFFYQDSKNETRYKSMTSVLAFIFRFFSPRIKKKSFRLKQSLWLHGERWIFKYVTNILYI